MWRSVRQELVEESETEEAAYGEPLDSASLAFAEQLLTNFAEHREELEAALADLITGWTFGQMSQTDLNVLRLALSEMRYGGGPPEVAIEMAVRLAKKFGGDESGRFVNGVLAKEMRQLGSIERVASGDGA